MRFVLANSADIKGRRFRSYTNLTPRDVSRKMGSVDVGTLPEEPVQLAWNLPHACMLITSATMLRTFKGFCKHVLVTAVNP